MNILCILFFPVAFATTMFPTDSEHLDLNNYYHFQKAFGVDEITRIQSFVKKDSFENSTISQLACPTETKKIRISEVQWIKDSSETSWLYKKILNMAKRANDAIYNFKLTHIKDSIQYTRYNQSGKYDWHVDLGQGDAALRKLSMVVLLTDPSTFEGGVLELRLGNRIVSAPLKYQGSVVIFPSFLLHRVTPVISGTRESLVVWISGFPFQ